jgi:phosphoribosylformylglycinamidine synthase
MASKGGVGIDIDVSSVPLREADMEPFEIMISESQERMLCVVSPERVEAVMEVCRHWEVTATTIGTVTDEDRLRILNSGSVVGDLPVHVLVDDCPLYDLTPIRPAVDLYPPARPALSGREPASETLLALLGSPNLASRRPLFEQYDPVVQSRTVRRPEQADAAVLALPGGSAIAVSIDGNGRRVACDPRRGAAEAVYECAANLACVGAEPLGLTNCLNFGNPEKPHVAWQLTEAVEGLAEACRALDIPVVGGNVSLYNEAPTGPIFPTPVVGIVGLLPEVNSAGRLGFVSEGDAIALVGPFHPSQDGSELAKLLGLAPNGQLPALDEADVRDALAAVRDGVRSGLFHSAHDIAEGGVGVALAECCLVGELGASVTIPDGLELFGEAPGTGFVVSGSREALDQASATSGADFRVIGQVGGDALQISGVLTVELDALHTAWSGGLA